MYGMCICSVCVVCVVWCVCSVWYVVCACVCVSPEYIKDAKGKDEERTRKGLVEKPHTT